MYLRERVVITIFDDSGHRPVCVCTLLFMDVYDVVELPSYRDEENLVIYTHTHTREILYIYIWYLPILQFQ